jgi:3-deoxy-D-manno-octulosonic-acid transferase
VCDATELAQAVDLWLTQPDQLQNARDAARHYVDEQSGQLDIVVDRLISSLGLHMPERAP